MNTATDTLQIPKYLKSLKFTDEQAEGLAKVVSKIDASNSKELVTQAFLQAELQSQLRQLENRLIIWMISLIVALAGLMIATRIFA